MRLSAMRSRGVLTCAESDVIKAMHAATMLGHRVTEMRNCSCFFSLTIYFDDSIQRTNCDEVMSQCSMKMERENRQHGNQEKGTSEEKGCKEEKEVTFLQTEHNGDAQASPNFLRN